MKKLNRAIIIISRIVEVFMWVGAGLSVIITLLSAVGKLDLIRFFTDATPGTELLYSGNFALRAVNAEGQPVGWGDGAVFFIEPSGEPLVFSTGIHPDNVTEPTTMHASCRLANLATMKHITLNITVTAE